MLYVSKSVTINRPRMEVYQFWRKLEHLPVFMQHLESVREDGPTRSHWVVRGPAGSSIEWDAEITREDPGRALEWHTLEGSEVANEGAVQFVDALGDRGTEVYVKLQYDAPAGSAGAAVAKLFGEEPSQQLRDDLRRLKQVLETGEVVRSEGSLLGAGQGATKQRPAPAKGAGA